MAIRIASSFPDTTIDTLTLSVHQQSLARERIREAGPEIASRIRVHLMDYRDIPPEWEGLFDRVISVEMIEAVGKEFLERYWEVVRCCALEPDLEILEDGDLTEIGAR